MFTSSIATNCIWWSNFDHQHHQTNHFNYGTNKGFSYPSIPISCQLIRRNSTIFFLFINFASNQLRWWKGWIQYYAILKSNSDNLFVTWSAVDCSPIKIRSSDLSKFNLLFFFESDRLGWNEIIQHVNWAMCNIKEGENSLINSHPPSGRCDSF